MNGTCLAALRYVPYYKQIKCRLPKYSNPFRENLYRLSTKDEIKFVINSRADYDWAVDILHRYKLHTQNLVLFSPVFDKMPPDQLAEWILVDRLPVRFQVQLHKVLWGETPGR